MVNKRKLLSLLEGYKHSMSEFDEEEMEYLISLVKRDFERYFGN